MDRSECCVQWSLLVANLPLALVVPTLLIIGAWTLTEPAFLESLQPAKGSLFTAVGVILVALGCLLLALSVLGCIDAFLESKCVLGICCACTLFIFALLCTAAAVRFVYRQWVENSLRDELSASIVDCDSDQVDAPITSSWTRSSRTINAGARKNPRQNWLHCPGQLGTRTITSTKIHKYPKVAVCQLETAAKLRTGPLPGW